MPATFEPTRFLRRLIPCLAALLAMASAVLPCFPAMALARSAATATPVAAERSGHLAEMLGRLPFLPLGTNDLIGINGAFVRYADVALQAEALGVTPPQDESDRAGQDGWLQAAGPLMFPEDAYHWMRPEWREAFGFDFFQVDQTIEYAYNGGMVAVLRGRFDPDELRAAWARQGYQPLDLGAGEAYARAEDGEIDFNDPVDRMTRGDLRVMAIASDGSLVYGRVSKVVELALAVIAGTSPSFAERAEIAPLLRAAPADLVTALFMAGDVLRSPSDAELEVYDGDTQETYAARIESVRADAALLPPVAAVLLGQPAGAPAESATEMPSPALAVPVQLVVVIAMQNQRAAEIAAEVIEWRLATRAAPASFGESLAGRPWTEFFPEHTVRVMPGGAVLIELTPAPDFGQRFLLNSIFSGWPGFLAWAEGD